MLARVQLGCSGLEIAPLGVGCWAWGDTRYWRYEEGYGQAEIIAAFDASVAAGLDFFDTAEVYGWGKSEKLVGALARRCKHKVLVATKYAPLSGRGGPAAVHKGIAGSLKRLGLPQIDLYQLHWADFAEVPIGPTMQVLAEIVRAGQARAVGVSNFRAAEMREAHAALAQHGVALASNQVHYSLLHRWPETDGLLDACTELGVTLLAYSPLEQGILTGKYSEAVRPRDARAEAAWFAPANLAAAQPVIAKLRTLAEAQKVQPAAVALAWLLSKPGVVPLPGAKTRPQAEANAQALKVELSAAEIAQLDELSAAWRSEG